MSYLDFNESINFEIIYKPDKNNINKVRIFGKIFVYQNKDNCKIIYKGNEYAIKENFEDINNNYNHKDEIKLILKTNYDITDLSYMFAECDTLISFSDITKNNFDQIIEENDRLYYKEFSSLDKSNSNEKLFYCNENSQLKLSSNISSIQKQDSSNSIDMIKIYFPTDNSKDLPPKTLNITNMSYMFYKCNSLISLPNL